VVNMKKDLLWIQLPKSWTILQQLLFEETVLRCSKQSCFITKSGTSLRSIVMGLSAKPLELLDVDRVKRDNVTVLRRYTGGGTVIVDNNILFHSWIMNNEDAETPAYPREIMKWTENFYSSTFSRAIASPHTEDRTFELLEHDYVVGSRKIGGNAQSITKDRWVHHTSFLWDFDESNMQYLQIPKKRPEYRQSRPHSDFLLRLKDIVRPEVTVDKFNEYMLEEVKQTYEVKVMNDENDITAWEQQLRASNVSFQPRTVVEILP